MTEPAVSAVTLGDIPTALKQGVKAKSSVIHAKATPAHKAAQAMADKVNAGRKAK